MNYLNEYAEPNTSIIYSVLTDKGQIMLICSNTSSITVMISDSSGVFLNTLLIHTKMLQYIQ